MKNAAKIRIASRKLAAGPGEDDQEALPHRPHLEGSVAEVGGNGVELGGLARRRHVADELHIAAERQPADLPPRALPVGPAGKLLPEADREGLGRNAEQPGDQIMAELVEEDERPQRADERDQDQPERRVGQHVHEQFAFIMAWARFRVTRSISNTSLIERGAA